MTASEILKINLLPHSDKGLWFSNFFNGKHFTAACTMIAVKWFKRRFTNPNAALGLYILFIASFGLTIIVNEVTFFVSFSDLLK